MAVLEANFFRLHYFLRVDFVPAYSTIKHLTGIPYSFESVAASMRAFVTKVYPSLWIAASTYHHSFSNSISIRSFRLSMIFQPYRRLKVKAVSKGATELRSQLSWFATIIQSINVFENYKIEMVSCTVHNHSGGAKNVFNGVNELNV